MMPKVSAVMTVHNGEPFLARALESWAAQTRLPDEFVVYNDASTDATAEVLAACSLPLKVIHGGELAGAGPGRRLAVQHAAGPLLLFLDADDFWPPDMVRGMLDAYAGIPCDGRHALFGKVRHFFDDSLDAAERIRIRIPQDWCHGHITGTMMIRRDDWLAAAPEPHAFSGSSEFQIWYANAMQMGFRFFDCGVHALERRVWKGNSSRAHNSSAVMMRVLKAHLDRRRGGNARPVWRSETFNDRWIMERVFPGRRGGYFVESGAADGRGGSSCFLLEHDLGWTGLCIEPHDAFFKELVRNRPNSRCENVCLAAESGRVDFVEGEAGPRAYFSGIADAIAKKKTANLPDSLGPVVGKAAARLGDLLDKHRAPSVIDYGAFDIEGSERDVLVSFPHERYRFLALSVECDEAPWGETLSVLQKWGYRVVENPFNTTMPWERYCLHESIL